MAYTRRYNDEYDESRIENYQEPKNTQEKSIHSADKRKFHRGINLTGTRDEAELRRINGADSSCRKESHSDEISSKNKVINIEEAHTIQ